MEERSKTRFKRWRLGLLVLVVALIASIPTVGGASSGSNGEATKPTVVLVHGAWADASGWSDVIERLQRAGYPVIAPANPLRSLESDSQYLASVLAQTPGQLVVVGHSYGGAVITNAAAGNPNVQALVYVAGFIPDVGEDILHLSGEGSQVPDSIEFKGFPPFGATDVDIYLKADMFRSTFAADLPSKTTAVMAASQRPIALLAASEPTTATAWDTIPSFALIPREDRAITPDQQRFMAQRAGATIREVKSSHVVMISNPNQVADLIIDAAEGTS